MLRCISFALARMKNSRRILAHLHPEIVLYHIRQGLTRGKFAKNAKSSAVPNAPAGASSFCNNKNQETWECAAKGSRGRAESPLVASADAKSPAMKKTSTGIVSRCWSVAPIWRDNVRVVGRASWVRICGRAQPYPNLIGDVHADFPSSATTCTRTNDSRGETT